MFSDGCGRSTTTRTPFLISKKQNPANSHRIRPDCYLAQMLPIYQHNPKDSTPAMWASIQAQKHSQGYAISRCCISASNLPGSPPLSSQIWNHRRNSQWAWSTHWLPKWEHHRISRNLKLCSCRSSHPRNLGLPNWRPIFRRGRTTPPYPHSPLLSGRCFWECFLRCRLGCLKQL